MWLKFGAGPGMLGWEESGLIGFGGIAGKGRESGVKREKLRIGTDLGGRQLCRSFHRMLYGERSQGGKYGVFRRNEILAVIDL